MANAIRSKFRDRKRSYQKMRKKEIDNLEGPPILIAAKVVVSIPLVIAGYAKKGIDRFFNNEKDSLIDKKCTSDAENKKTEYFHVNNSSPTVKKVFRPNEKIIKRTNKSKNNSIKDILRKSTANNLFIKEEREINIIRDNQSYNNKNNVVLCKSKVSTEKEEFIENKIIKSINKKIKKTKDELEILYGEYYALKEIYNDKDKSEECIKQLTLIKKLISKIEKIKIQYNILKENYDLDSILELEDNDLIDDIVKFKQIVDNYDDKVLLTTKYKELKGFFNIYDEIKEIEYKVDLFEQEKLQRLEEQRMREEDFKKFQLGLIDSYEKEINVNKQLKEQEQYLKKMEAVINHIESREIVSYKFNGFSELIANSFKYLGLLALHPLSGLLPSIIINTKNTRKMINNLRNSLDIERTSKIIYEAVDYEHELNSHLYNLSGAQNLLTFTLTEIKDLKYRYSEKFESFKYKFPEYEKNYRILEKFEKQICNNQNKVKIMQDNLEKNKKINSDKLKKIKKLNKDQSNL